MPKREDETWLNVNPPLTKSNRKRYPYLASMECPACGNLSMYYSDEHRKYRCMNEQCQIEGETLEDILAKVAKHREEQEAFWKQIRQSEGE
jgi:hypothetical protein